jgi:uncharacterized protein
VPRPLVIHVDSIKENAQPYEADISRELIDEALRGDPPTEFHANGASHFTGNLTKLGRKVLVRGKFSVPMVGACRRCVKPVGSSEPTELIRTYVPRDDRSLEPHGKRRKREERADKDEEGTAASFDPETVDEEVYDGKEIDLGEAIREQILLALPPAPLCREDCKGLCATCGKDLNEGECGCDRAVHDPRWDALKALQLEKKE